MIIIIFGGNFLIGYFIMNELLLNQIIALSVGIILLIASLIWRKVNHKQ